MDASELEIALLSEFHALYGANGFPSPSEVVVVSRDNTGGGRYVQVSASNRVTLKDGYYDLGGKFIQMQGVPNGMMAVARIVESDLLGIEITVYGGDYWDGKERAWSLE